MGNDWQAVFGAQFTVFGLAWLLAARCVPQERGPLCCWGLYALLQAVHHLVRPWLEPGPWPSQWLYSLSLWGSLLGALGVDLFLNRRPRHLRVWAALAVAGGLLPPLLLLIGLPTLVRAVVFNLVVVASIWWPLWLFGGRVREEFGLPGRFMMGALALAGLPPLLRTMALLADPSLLGPGLVPGPVGVLTLLPALMAGLVVQLIFLAMMVSRLMNGLRRMARHDGLTGLLNRMAFEEAVRQAWAVGQRRPSPLSLAFLDIDHFKRINDEHGHAAGDRALQAVAEMLREQARAVDRVARLGGEEFVVLMPDTDAQGALLAAQRLQADLRQRQLPLPAGCGVLTVSIGVCTVTHFDGDPSALLALADQAMYQAKQQGRDRIAVSPGPTPAPQVAPAGEAVGGLSAC